MNLIPLYDYTTVLVDIIIATGIDEQDIEMRQTTIPSRDFAEFHLDFDTDTHQFWVKIDQKLDITLYRHSLNGYCREKYVFCKGISKGFMYGKTIESLINGL